MTANSSCMKCGAPLVNVAGEFERCANGHLETRDTHLFGKLPMIEVTGAPHAYEGLTPPGKFISPEPLPTPYERELLIILIEECAEVMQRATKMLRFGVEEIQPGQPDTNRLRLSDETGDLYAMLERCLAENLLCGARMRRAQIAKMTKLKKYMQTTKETTE